jgi:hypothetical protein
MRNKLLILLIFLVWSSSYAQKQVTEIHFNSVNTSEADSIRTLKSLKKTDNLYMMTYYGDYEDRLDKVDYQIINNGFKLVTKLKGGKIECSMFAAFGSSLLYGRNFDNPDCGVLVTIYHPTDGYASIGFSRINDLGFEKDDDPRLLSLEKRRLLLNSPFFTPDGLNENGVAVALAALKSVNIKVDKNKKSIFITRLVREILDHAQNIDEAVSIIKKYNIFDNGVNKASHHLLISDPSGRSVIVEYAKDDWQVLPNKRSWQAITNSPLFKIAEDSRKKTCWRYKTITEQLEKNNGIMTWEDGMNLLEQVSVEGTQWSTICDIKKKEIYISIYRNYSNIKKINF